MRKQFTILALTLLCLGLMDFAVAHVLSQLERRGVAGSLVRYFEYGRSVPGKLAVWEAEPDRSGNLYDLGWQGAILTGSGEQFADEEGARVIRAYGMSFSNNILFAAATQNPELQIDLHSGPGVPPNFTYALALDDADARRAGDVAVLAILSSSVPAMVAMSNRTWVFEQPAPFTYPVFYPEGTDGLRRVDPSVTSAAEERALHDDPVAAAAWAEELAREDAFYTVAGFAWPALDASPFMRLVRRSLATRRIGELKGDVLRSGRYPYATVLERMVRSFADRVQADGQTPVVFLIQSRDPGDVDLLALLGPVLRAAKIPYLATAEHVDPRDGSAFVGDGHYTPAVDARFGAAFLTLLEGL